MQDAKILVVEDERIVAADIRQSLEKMGYGVCAVVSSGEEAVKKAVETLPDLVLMDISLKGEIDGIDAAHQIRRLCNLPVVYLTAHSDEATIQKAKITEPYGYILKPFEDRELNIAIAMALYKHQAETKIRILERMLATTLKSIGDAVIASDLQRRITFMNRVAEELTGWKQEEALGRKLTDVLNIMDEELCDLENRVVEKVIKEGLIINLLEDSLLVGKDGRVTPIADSIAPIKDELGRVPGTVIIFRDITKQKEMAKTLSENEKRFRFLYDNALFACQSLCEDAHLLEVNQTWLDSMGYRREEVIGLWFGTFMSPASAVHMAERLSCLKSEESVRNVELEVIRKDGTSFMVSLDGRVSRDNHGRFMMTNCIFVDITERRQKERKLEQQHRQIRLLAERLTRVQEKERMQLARELHDQVGQNLTAIGINLNILRSGMQKQGEETMVKRVNDTMHLVEQTSAKVRDVMIDLRPPVLDDYGLISVIDWYCRLFATRTGITVNIEKTVASSEKFHADVETAFFRILQEALTNIAKHANASHVLVLIEESDGMLRLIISDNGTGFEPEKVAGLDTAQCWGLLNMEERARMIGGSFSLESAAGKGTKITVEASL